MLGVPLDIRVRRTLAVTVGAGLALALDEKAGAYFPAHLAQPSGDNGLLDGAPRTELSVWRLYWGPTTILGACDRIEVPGDTTYELISRPRKLSAARLVVGFSAPLLPVSALYPRSAEVRERGAAKALATIACAIYSERDESLSRGRYVDTFIDAPPSAYEALTGAHQNRELHFADGSVWNVGDVTLAPELPYVSGTIRKVA
jgi:hypothetical protein